MQTGTEPVPPIAGLTVADGDSTFLHRRSPVELSGEFTYASAAKRITYGEESEVKRGVRLGRGDRACRGHFAVLTGDVGLAASSGLLSVGALATPPQRCTLE